MPGINQSIKRNKSAIANLKTVSKLISSSKYYGYLNRIYAADSGKRGDRKIQDINALDGVKLASIVSKNAELRLHVQPLYDRVHEETLLHP